MYDVFISYSRKDSKIADRICSELKKNNITYFIDRKGIAGGLEFPEIIVDAIENSKVFLFIGSKNSYASRYVINEVTYMYNVKGEEVLYTSDLPAEGVYETSASGEHTILFQIYNPQEELEYVLQTSFNVK